MTQDYFGVQYPDGSIDPCLKTSEAEAEAMRDEIAKRFVPYTVKALGYAARPVGSEGREEYAAALAAAIRTANPGKDWVPDAESLFTRLSRGESIPYSVYNIYASIRDEDDDGRGGIEIWFKR